MTTGAEIIANERKRQIEEEGWSANHDDLLERYELSKAAIAYMNPTNGDHVSKYWPFNWKWWKPVRVNAEVPYAVAMTRNLEKAGALIAAEIDRLIRLRGASDKSLLKSEGVVVTGAQLITNERQRQIEVEGWSANHDDLWDRYQLSNAAIAYLIPSNSDHVRTFWPFDLRWWKPTRASMETPYEIAQMRNLEKAGALVAAEIDRLERLLKTKEG